jgi:thymidylate synthase
VFYQLKQYQDMLYHILKNGEAREDRTGTGIIGVFGYQNRYDLSKGFPLMTTKKTSLRIIFEELKWFLNGDTDIKYLLDKNVNIWNADAYRDYLGKTESYSDSMVMTFDQFVEFSKEHGYDLGSVYGKQWRSWSAFQKAGNGNVSGEDDYYSDADFGYTKTIDQIANVIDSLKNDPYGRRHIVSAWNVGELDEMALPPCHLLFQFYVSNDKKLSCQLYQRSADTFLGVPFNIASYSMLVHIIAHLAGLQVGEFIHTFGDAHIYLNHIKQVKEQLFRDPKELPKLEIVRDVKNIDDLVWEDFSLTGYDPHPAIKGDVSVGL